MHVYLGPIEIDLDLAIIVASLGTILSFAAYRESRTNASERDRLQRNLHDSPDLRETTASKISEFSAGTIYYNALSKSLAFVSRYLGPPGGCLAFGSIVAIALYYSWCTFVLDWVLGGSGSVFGIPVLMSEASNRLPLGLISIIGVMVLFLGASLLGQYVGLDERFPTNIAMRLLLVFLSLLPFAILGIGARTDQSDGDVTIFGFSPDLTETDVLFLAVGALFLTTLSGTLLGDVLALRCKRLRSNIAVASLGSAIAPVIALLLYWAVFRDLFTSGVGDSSMAKLVGLRSVAFLGAIGAILISLLAGPRSVLLLFLGVSAAGAYAILPDGPTHHTLTIASYVAVFSLGVGFFAGFLRARTPQRYATGPGRAAPYFAIMGASLPLLGTVFALLRRLEQPSWANVAATFEALSGASAGFNSLSTTTVASIAGLFLIVLPIGNGVLDWLSWLTSRKLGEHLKTSIDNARSTSNVLGSVILHATIDFACAIAFLGLLAFAFGLGFGYIENAFTMDDEVVEILVRSAVDHPWRPGWGLWYSVMLMSTLVPTAVHGLFLFASPLSMVTARRRKRRLIAGDLRRWSSLDTPNRKRVAADASEFRYQSMAPLIFAAAVPLFVIALLVWLLIWRIYPSILGLFGDIALAGEAVLFWIL
ncbi:MAG: hypothetical protein OXJ90_18555 [Spirochaetaceae bacterium]|nr:hypothetical protein [Spirochaetaceae bacterium]